MNEPSSNQVELFESLIRQAGDYADVTPDLRPRIMRSAKRNRCRARLRSVGCVVVFLALTLPLTGDPLHRSLLSARPMVLSLADSPRGEWMPIRQAGDVFWAATALDGKDGSWGAVSIFRHIHARRQEVFSLRR